MSVRLRDDYLLLTTTTLVGTPSFSLDHLCSGPVGRIHPYAWRSIRKPTT